MKDDEVKAFIEPSNKLNKEIYELLLKRDPPTDGDKFKKALANFIENKKSPLSKDDKKYLNNLYRKMKHEDIISLLGDITTQFKLDLYNRLREKDYPEDISKIEARIKDLLKKSKDENYPRRLTEEELDYITEVIPLFPAPIKKISDFNREQVINEIKDGLREERISPLVITRMRNELYKYCIKASISPGESVGINSSTAISQMLTQKTLNTFHSSGKAQGVESGANIIDELLNVKQNKKMNLVITQLLDKTLTQEEVIQQSKYIIGNTLQKLINVKDEIRSYVPEEDHWWYDLNVKCLGVQFPYSNYKISEDEESDFRFVRIYLNRTKLYRFDLLTSKVAKSLSEEDGLVVFSSPTYLGIIDVYVHPDVLMDTKIQKKYKGSETLSEEDYQVLYLKDIFLNRADDIRIQGITGIEDLFAQEVKLNSMLNSKRVDDISIVNKYDSLDLWEYTISNEAYFLSLTRERFIKMFQTSDMYFDVYPSDDPNKFYVDSEQDPLKLLTALYDKQRVNIENIVAAKLNSINEQEDFSLPEYPELYRYYNYCFPIFQGKNIFKKLITKYSLIEKNFTYPNNPREIEQFFGIHSTSVYLNREYTNLIEDLDSGFNPVNIETLVSFQTALGTANPVTHAGAARQGGSALSMAAFRNPMDAFRKAAGIGTIDKVKGVSGCVMTGKKCSNGTGIVKVEIPIENMEPSFTEKKKSKSRSSKVDDNEYVTPIIVHNEYETNLIDEDPTIPKVGKKASIPVVRKMKAPKELDFLGDDSSEESLSEADEDEKEDITAELEAEESSEDEETEFGHLAL